MGKLEQATLNFGKHTVSGLCLLIPELYWECHQVPIWHVNIDLLAEEPLPDILRNSKELADITDKLRGKFFEILAKHSLYLSQTVSELQIFVEFPESSPEELRRFMDTGGYYFHSPSYFCRVSTKNLTGRRYEASFSEAWY